MEKKTLKDYEVDIPRVPSYSNRFENAGIP